MTYSYNNYSSGNDNDNNQQNSSSYNPPSAEPTSEDTTEYGRLPDLGIGEEIADTIDDVRGIISDLPDPIKEKLEEQINEWYDEYPDEDKGAIFRLIECVGEKFQLKEGVKEYDYNNVLGVSDPQFENCPDAPPFYYDSGWDYVDYTVGSDKGFTSSDVRVVRLGKLGAPTGYDNEVNNPYRIKHLPNRATKMITAEPKKFLWIHPFLERATEDLDGETTTPIAFSRFGSMDTWQSGKISNGPSDSDVYNGCGFNTSPGGKQSGADVHGARLRYSTSKSGQKWLGIWGNSRGVETLGYPDEPTEGMEYGCVGFSGFFISSFNRSAGTTNNGGIKFAYTMYRIDTSVTEIAANAQALGELIDSIDNGGGSYSIDEPIGFTEEISTLNLKSGGQWTDSEKATIKKLVERADRKANAVKDSGERDFNIRDLHKSNYFKKLSEKTLPNNRATLLALDVIFETINYKINSNMGRKESDHETIINCDNLAAKIEDGMKVTLKDFFNNVYTKILIGDDRMYDAVGMDFDFEKIGAFLNEESDDSAGIDILNFVVDTKEQRDLDKIRYRNGQLVAILKNGFEITLQQYLRRFEGWCDACDEFGGNIEKVDGGTYQCVRLLEDEYRTNYSYEVLDRYEVDRDEGFGNPYSLYKSEYSSPGVDNPQTRIILPAEAGENITKEIKPGVTVTAQQWRGLWAVPSTGPGSQPYWKAWEDTVDPETGEPNKVHTYGPFKKKEFDIYYWFITPDNGHEQNPRTDYGLTYWFSTNPDGPWKQGPTSPPQNAPGKSGYQTNKPRNYYFRVSFWQWRNETGKIKGPAIKPEMYPPGYYVGGKTIDGKSPQGMKFDAIVTPAQLNGDPFEHFKDNDIGPCYLTKEENIPLELPDLEHKYWLKPIKHIPLGKSGWYKIWTKLKEDQNNEELTNRNEPSMQGVYAAVSDDALDIADGGGTAYRDYWEYKTALEDKGEANYRYVFLGQNDQQVVFASRDETRDYSKPDDDRDWAAGGENWIEFRKVDAKNLKIGPAYWSELHRNRERPNFYDTKFQTPLNVFDTDAYDEYWKQDDLNVQPVEGIRYRIRANTDASNEGKLKTKYTYDVYFANERAFLDRIRNIDDVSTQVTTGKPHFIFVGTIEPNDGTGFVITVPKGEHMIFAARETKRLRDSWGNNGEDVSIVTRYETNPRDERIGPAYWAFGDDGLITDIRRGYRGYVDFNDAYWKNPLYDWNEDRQAIRVIKGQNYTFTPGPDMLYTHRIIWGDSEQAKSPIIYNNPLLTNTEYLEGVNRTWFEFEDDNDLLLRPTTDPASKEVTVTAKGDYLYFGAMRTGTENNGADRPTKEEWSRFGEPIDITIQEEAVIEGCSHWGASGAFTAGTQANLNDYNKPIVHLVEEMRSIANDRGEDISELEEYFSKHTDENGVIRTYVRTFEITPGRNYHFERTADTPQYDYAIRFLKAREDLSKTAYEDITPDIFKNKVWRATNDDSLNHIRIENIPSEYICFTAFDTQRNQPDWSKKGEPVFMEVSEEIQDGVINGRQYWTDWDKPDSQVPTAYKKETANGQLNDRHWKNPLWAIDTEEEIYPLEAGKQYKFWVDDSNDALGAGQKNPEYMHVFFAEKDPNAIQVGAKKDYTILGATGNQDLPFEERQQYKQNTPGASWNGEQNGCIFTIPEDKRVIVIGAWQTGDRRTAGLPGWNSEGEPIKIRYQEVPAKEIRGPVYWANHVTNSKDQQIPKNVDITRTYAYPDLHRGEDVTAPPSASNPKYYETCFSYGQNGNETDIRIGQRYRMTMNIDEDSYEPEEFADGMPYNMRWWWAKNAPKALNPDTSSFSDFTAGRCVTFNNDHTDFIAKESTMVFGAFTPMIDRTEMNWSRTGEPTNWNIELLPRVPVSGPAYFSQENKFPSVLDRHFYKPLNFERVDAGSTYAIEKGNNWDTQTGKIQFWFIKDDTTDSWKNQDAVLKSLGDGNFYPPVPIEGLHPEDLATYGRTDGVPFIPDASIEDNYIKGPIIDFNGDPNNVKIPDGCTRVFFGWSGRTGKTLNQWSRDGEPIPFTLEKKEYGTERGPVYWGDGVGKNPEFNNNHFDAPLNYVTLESNELYKVTKKPGTWFQNYNDLDIYGFNPLERDVLDPTKNRIGQFTKIGTFNENDTEVLINTRPGETGIIFSAKNVNPNVAARVTDWPPKGREEPLKFEKSEKIKGPIYYAKHPDSWNASPGGQPDFSKDHWQGQINALKVPQGEVEIWITENLVNHDLDMWYCVDKNALTPGATNRKSLWNKMGTFQKGSKKDDWLLVPQEAKYIVAGFYKPKAGTPSADRTLANWSPFGEPSIFKFKQRRWGKGPGYPAHKKQNNNWKIDLNETRWERPFASPLTPKRKQYFKPGIKYEFNKRKGAGAGGEYMYQMVWSKNKNPRVESDLHYGRKLSTKAPADKSFKLIPPGNYKYVYFSIYDGRNNGISDPGTGDVRDWSPKGTDVPWTAQKERRELPVPPGGLIWWILALLTAILAALLGFLLYFFIMAPLDTVMEMNEEHDFNKYPIRRKKIVKYTNEEGEERTGYGYPDVKYLKDDNAFYTGMGNDPLFMNYTSDVGVRIWARIMKLRHNGYMFHIENASKSNTSSSNTKENYTEFLNLTPTYGFNFAQLNSRRFKRAFRYYNGPAKDRNVSRWNPYESTGVRVIRPDVTNDPVKQNYEWDNKLVWFTPALSYVPQLGNARSWRPYEGGPSYALDSNYTSNGGKKAFPCIKAPNNRLPDIFNPRGAGLTVNKYYSSESGSHAHCLTIMQSDMDFKWPGIETGRGDYYPGLDFDLKFIDGDNSGARANWQIVRIDLNYVYWSPFEDGYVPLNRYSRKLSTYTENSDDFKYEFRNTFNNGANYSNYKQLNKDRPLINIKAQSLTGVDEDSVLESITFVIWIGADNTSVDKDMIISNLKPTIHY